MKNRKLEILKRFQKDTQSNLNDFFERTFMPSTPAADHKAANEVEQYWQEWASNRNVPSGDLTDYRKEFNQI